jgi:hypothetical protein
MDFEIFNLDQSIGWGSSIGWFLSHFCFSKFAECQSIDPECQSIDPAENFHCSYTASLCNRSTCSVNRLVLWKFHFSAKPKAVNRLITRANRLVHTHFHFSTSQNTIFPYNSISNQSHTHSSNTSILLHAHMHMYNKNPKFITTRISTS